MGVSRRNALDRSQRVRTEGGADTANEFVDRWRRRSRRQAGREFRILHPQIHFVIAAMEVKAAIREHPFGLQAVAWD